MNRRHFLIAASALSLALAVSGAKCNHGGSSSVAAVSASLRTAAPPGSATITVSPLENGTTDDAAVFARRVIWTYAPGGWIPPAERVVIRSAEPGEIAETIAADRYAAAGFNGTFSNDGFTSIAGNDTRSPTGPTTIYLSKGIWGQSNVIGEVALHESSHVYYWRRLTVAQQAAWRALWGDAKARGVLPTAYAGTNEYEGFAESAAYWMVGKLADPELRAWFKALPP